MFLVDESGHKYVDVTYPYIGSENDRVWILLLLPLMMMDLRLLKVANDGWQTL
jgi:hypothetical protein